MIVCGACAVLVYHILEPFLPSILWSILAGAFLFPFKTRYASLAHRYLRQLDADSHLLIAGLLIRLPIKIIDHIIESLGPIMHSKLERVNITCDFFYRQLNFFSPALSIVVA